MIVESLILSVVIALIRKGKFSNFNNITIKGWYLIVISALLQTITVTLSNSSNTVIVDSINIYYVYIHILSYLLLLIALIINIKYKEFILLVIGTLMNFIVIIFNNGKMPFYLPYGKAKVDIFHTLMNKSTKIKILADIIPIPKPYPLPKILSIGDIFIIVGVFIFVQNIMVSESKKQYINE